MKKRWILGFVAVLLLAACQPSAPLREFTKGDLLASYEFTDTGSFEAGIFGGANLQITDGTYEIDVTQGDNALWWGQAGDNYGDVVIEVDANQLSERNENAFGVMCRVAGSVRVAEVDPTLAAVMQDSTPEATAAATSEATAEATVQVTAEATGEATAEPTAEVTSVLEPTALLTATPEPTRVAVSEGDGYLFLIQGGGTFAIMRSRDRNLTPLVDWRASEAIKPGPAQNHLRAVCVGNYLALYVNDQFLGDATDDTYSSGQVGLAASAATRLGTRIAFDNLTISAAAPK